jgi:hypothetical protein
MNPGVNRLGRYLCYALVVFAACCVAGAQNAQSQDTITPLDIAGVVEGRFVVPDPPSLKEGEVNEILVDVTARGVTAHDVSVSVRYADLMGQSYNREDNRDGLPLKRHSDGTMYFEFTPTHLGDVEMSVGITFADGLIEVEETKGTVGFSDAKPSRLLAMGTERVPNSLVLGMPKSDPDASKDDFFPLHPEAFFEGQPHPVPIPAADVRYTVFAVPGQEPPITVDPATGVVQTVHIGHALIRMSFEGATGYLCIDVRQSYRESANRASCSDLVPKGESLPPAQPPSPIGWKRVMPPPARPQ